MMPCEFTGGFTMPGEAGYDNLVLSLAKRWGADVIRDSDGTTLSPELLNSGYDIYSTICIIRDHNKWASEHPKQIQQSFLMSEPIVAVDDILQVDLLASYFTEQFKIDESPESQEYWQVFDRTTGKEINREDWKYDSGIVTIISPIKWHKYTVNFLVFRIWEEISMYNHITNHWNKEHLIPINPYFPETAEYLRNWLVQWCETHPQTDFVRFTSMFYNFVWIWGSDERHKNKFTDWASYDFTVSIPALRQFEIEYGYRITSEDFINQGHLNPTHLPANKQKKDWMKFINNFVVSFGGELIEIVHSYGKKALVFYDDSWVGTEPCNSNFKNFGFDGIIKCVFSAFEVRLCSSVESEIHEIRLHPYLFPTGVDGSPSFLPGGTPDIEARKYWMNVRRGLLRAKIDRIGLGGYLHLVESKPKFVEYIEKIADEFRKIRNLHLKGNPLTYAPQVAVLHCWGSQRPWTLSGHFHETYMHELIHVNESLAGLPFNVSFIDFDDIRRGCLSRYDCIINCGRAGTAWSGGEEWNDSSVIEKLTEYVYNGGALIGIGEPSAVDGYDNTFRLSHVYGVDLDSIMEACHGHYSFDISSKEEKLIPDSCFIEAKTKVFLIDDTTEVLQSDSGYPTVTLHQFGSGQAAYLASYQKSAESARLLQNLILYTCSESLDQEYCSDNPNIDTAYFPESKTLVLANSSESNVRVKTIIKGKVCSFDVPAYDTVFANILD